MLAVVVAVGGCRETGTFVQSGVESGPAAISPRAVVVTTGASTLVTLVLDVHGDVGKIGSVTGRLRFNPSALRYDGEVDLADGTMRASNPEASDIRVASASALGLNVARLATFRFVVIDAALPQNLTFDVEELHELSRTNLQAQVVRTGDAGARP